MSSEARFFLVDEEYLAHWGTDTGATLVEVEEQLTNVPDGEKEGMVVIEGHIRTVAYKKRAYIQGGRSLR